MTDPTDPTVTDADVNDASDDLPELPPAEAVKREVNAMRMRALGATFQQIADTYGMTRSGARKMVLRAFREAAAERDHDTMLEQATQRAEIVIQASSTRGAAGDPKANMVILRANQQLIRLRGLDAPRRHQITVTSAENAVGAAIDQLLTSQPWLAIEQAAADQNRQGAA